MATPTEPHQNKHHFRAHLVPEKNEGLDVGLEGRRFGTGRFAHFIADTLDVLVTSFTAITATTATFTTGLILSFLTGPGYLKIDASEATTIQAVPIPLADGGTGATSLAAGYIKSNATVFSSQAVPIPIADGGTNAITAAAARTSLAVAPLDATFVTLSTNSELSNERVLTAGNGVALVDGGAGSTITLNILVNPITQQVFGG